MPLTADGRPYIQEGPPMYVESCMTANELQQWQKSFSTHRESGTRLPVSPQDKGFKWRYGMGYGLSSEEIANINNNIDYLKSTIKR